MNYYTRKSRKHATSASVLFLVLLGTVWLVLLWDMFGGSIS